MEQQSASSPETDPTERPFPWARPPSGSNQRVFVSLLSFNLHPLSAPGWLSSGAGLGQRDPAPRAGGEGPPGPQPHQLPPPPPHRQARTTDILPQLTRSGWEVSTATLVMVMPSVVERRGGAALPSGHALMACSWQKVGFWLWGRSPPQTEAVRVKPDTQVWTSQPRPPSTCSRLLEFLAILRWSFIVPVVYFPHTSQYNNQSGRIAPERLKFPFHFFALWLF